MKETKLKPAKWLFSYNTPPPQIEGQSCILKGQGILRIWLVNM